jgi:hypothetical protein
MFLVTFTINKTSQTTAPAQGVVQGKTTGPLTVFTIFGSVGLRHFTARELVNYLLVIVAFIFSRSVLLILQHSVLKLP